MNTKLKPDDRKSVILAAAIHVANSNTLGEVNFKNVAEACRVTTTVRTVKHYYKIKDLRKAVAFDPRSSDMVKADAVAMGIKI